MIDEIFYDETDKTFTVLRYTPVAVTTYGSEGSIPVHRDSCPLSNNNGLTACVSGSGGSICGGYHGHISDDVVRCMERKK